MGKKIKCSTVFLFIFSLTACQFSHTPQITPYKLKDSEYGLLYAAGIKHAFLYNYNLEDKKPPSQLQFWIESFDKGRKVDETHKTFDFKGMGNKGKIAILIPDANGKQLQTYRIAVGKKFEVSSTDTLKDIGMLGEQLSGLSVWGINPKADIKYNQPILLAVQVFSFNKRIGALDNQIYTNSTVLNKLKQDHVVIVYKCQFDTKKN